MAYYCVVVVVVVIVVAAAAAAAAAATRSEYDPTTSWRVLSGDGHLGDDFSSGGSFIVKVDINQNRVSADENTENTHKFELLYSQN